MNTAVRTRIVKVGNSQGIRIPRFLLDQLGLGEEVELAVEGDQLIIRPLRQARQGWDEQFRQMAERGDDHLLDETALRLTEWDEEEWEWS